MLCHVIKESLRITQSNNTNVITCNFRINAWNSGVYPILCLTYTIKLLTRCALLCALFCFVESFLSSPSFTFSSWTLIEFSILFTNSSTLVTASNNQTIPFCVLSVQSFCVLRLLSLICISTKSKYISTPCQTKPNHTKPYCAGISINLLVFFKF